MQQEVVRHNAIVVQSPRDGIDECAASAGDHLRQAVSIAIRRGILTLCSGRRPVKRELVLVVEAMIDLDRGNSSDAITDVATAPVVRKVVVRRQRDEIHYGLRELRDALGRNLVVLKRIREAKAG